MRNFFLNLPAWALFLIIFVLPIVVYMTAVASMMPTNYYMYPDSLDTDVIFAAVKWTIIICLVPALFLWAGWYMNVGLALAEKLPSTVKMPVSFFKTNMFILIGYLLFLGVYLVAVMSWFNENAPEAFIMSMNGEELDLMQLDVPLPGWFLGGGVIFFFGGLYLLFVTFHSFWFLGKSLVAVEKGEVYDFNDYSGPFFMFWFWLIGVWWLQPRIQAVLAKEAPTKDPFGADDDPFSN